MNYENIRIDKSMYKNAGGFVCALEKLDPSERYTSGELAGMDAFQRQLKRFDIKVSGKNSSQIAKFFSTVDSAALFPEYVSRAVSQGRARRNHLRGDCQRQDRYPVPRLPLDYHRHLRPVRR